MGSTEISYITNYESVKRFLQTAVVVDDNPCIREGGASENDLTVPDRYTPSQQDSDTEGTRTELDIDAEFVVEAFAGLGIICSVMRPSESQSEIEVMRKADIVILDWKLRKDDPEYALKLLENLLTGEQDRNSLRLVAIYTGEPQLKEQVHTPIFKKLEEAELNPEGSTDDMVISYQYGQVVLYAKDKTPVASPLDNRIIDERELPERLVQDFAEMTKGLLPSIALTSLTAVREGEHKILERFSADLDPAFLTQRVCISDPNDAEQQIVNLLAEELRGLMSSLVAEKSPAGTEAVMDWVNQKYEENGCVAFKFGEKDFSQEDTITLVKEGLAKIKKLKSAKAFQNLSDGFAQDEAKEGIDLRLAWMMSFRTVFNAPLPTLWLGSVVTEFNDDNEGTHLLCMRPRCDCVRLKERTSFLFLPLIEPKSRKDQLVLRLDKRFERVSIGFDQNDWVVREFQPLGEGQKVTAIPGETDDQVYFKDIESKQYIWRGELKSGYAQRVIQNFARKLSRVGLDDSEWLRRMARL